MYSKNITVKFYVDTDKSYKISIEQKRKRYIEELKQYALDTLIRAEDKTQSKNVLWEDIKKIQTSKEYVKTILNNSNLRTINKKLLLEPVFFGISGFNW